MVLESPKSLFSVLVALRYSSVLLQLGLLAVCQFALLIELPFAPMLAMTLALSVFAVLAQLRKKDSSNITHAEVFFYLCVDVLQWAWFLYFSGGASNPFITLFLLYVALCVMGLNEKYGALMLLLCATVYGFLMYYYKPLPVMHHRFGGMFNFHLSGMWFNFLLSAILLMGFITYFSRKAKEDEKRMQVLREKNLKSEHFLRLGTMSVSVAHEINTPLNSMIMLNEELLENPRDEVQKELLMTLQSQMALCQTRIQSLLSDPQRGTEPVALGALIQQVQHEWQLMRPEITLDMDIHPAKLQGVVSPLLSQALFNVLNNGADASAENGVYRCVIQVCQQQDLIITVRDFGRGLKAHPLKPLALRSPSNKSGGHGLGLVLSHATLEQMNGQLRLRPWDNGTEAVIQVPVET